MLSRLLFAVVVFTLSASASLAAGPTELAKGKIADSALEKLAPKSGFITNANNFAKLWKAWRPEEAVPEVDFTSDLVIVGIASGPNLVMFDPKLHEDGNVKFVVASTRMAGPGFGYRLVKISRDGVKKINGKSIEEGIVQGTITIPETSTELSDQVIEVKLFEFDPLLSDVSAKLVDKTALTGIQHESGQMLEVPFAVGADYEIQKDRRYYITVIALQGKTRTHIGEIEGKRGLNIVLQNGDRMKVNVVLRELAN